MSTAHGWVAGSSLPPPHRWRWWQVASLVLGAALCIVTFFVFALMVLTLVTSASWPTNK